MNPNIKSYQADIGQIKDFQKNENENISNISNKINNIDKNIKYNKVINAFIGNPNEKEMKIISDDNNKEPNKTSKNLEDINNYNIENSKKIEPLSELLLVKNTIGQENIQPVNLFENRAKENNSAGSVKKPDEIIKNDNNINEPKKEEEKEEKKEEEEKQEEKKQEEEKKEEANNKEENKENTNNEQPENNNEEEGGEENHKVKIEKGELDLTYNFDDDVFNVTEEQMNILDGDVNRIYKRYKNYSELKNFKVNHPKLRHNIKLINNNLQFVVSPMTNEERKKRLSPIFEKQKLILEKIKKDNISRNHISISNNNDSIKGTKSKINYSNKIFSPYKINNINNNSNGNVYKNYIQSENNNGLSPYHNSNTISYDRQYYNYQNSINYNNNNNINQRYQNLYNNNNSIMAENRINYSNSNDKNNDIIKAYKRKIIFEPYTLDDYRKKFENHYTQKKLGGLGANIGGEEWKVRQKLLERKKQYSEYIKNDEEFNIINKKSIKLKNENNSKSKTIPSNKNSVISSDRLTDSINNKYSVLQTESNIYNSNQLKLPLIKERFKRDNTSIIKNNINLRRVYNSTDKKRSDLNKIKKNMEYIGKNPLNQNNMDFYQLINQYEEYNGKL